MRFTDPEECHWAGARGVSHRLHTQANVRPRPACHLRQDNHLALGVQFLNVGIYAKVRDQFFSRLLDYASTHQTQSPLFFRIRLTRLFHGLLFIHSVLVLIHSALLLIHPVPISVESVDAHIPGSRTLKRSTGPAEGYLPR